MKFANGWQVSVQWGAGNYCDHCFAPAGLSPEFYHRSDTAEVLVTRPDGKDEQVKGWMRADEVAILLSKVARKKAETRE
jgi:hypothetical protein